MTAIDTKHTGFMKKPSETFSNVEVLVLAGARASGDELAQAHGVPSKAHIRVAGRSMIARVLDALAASQSANQIYVVGMQAYDQLQPAEGWPAVRHMSGARGPAASVYNVLTQFERETSVLVTTCDHALLSPAIIDQFLQDTDAANADLTVALARREDIEAAYPDVRRTYLNFGDGAYSSCNLFCLKTPAANSVVKFWQRAEQDRKQPWRIAWRFGIIPALRILIGRPSQEKVFAIVSKCLGVTIKAVVLPYADAAVDVDTQEDLTLVERVIAERSQ